MNAKNISRGLVSKFQKTLLAVVVLTIVFSSAPSGRAEAASSFVGSTWVQVTCLKAQYAYRQAFYGTYDGQWVYYRLWVRNTTTGVYSPTPWQYTQAYTWDSMGGQYQAGDIYQSAATGTIMSIKVESYFYNRTYSTWDYVGTVDGAHYQTIALGTPKMACAIY